MHTAFVTHLSESLTTVHHVMHSSSALKETCCIHYRTLHTIHSVCASFIRHNVVNLLQNPVYCMLVSHGEHVNQ